MHLGSVPFPKGLQLERLSTQASTSPVLSQRREEMYQTSFHMAVLGLEVRRYPPH
jgi:hypothetical protein